MNGVVFQNASKSGDILRLDVPYLVELQLIPRIKSGCIQFHVVMSPWPMLTLTITHDMSGQGPVACCENKVGKMATVRWDDEARDASSMGKKSRSGTEIDVLVAQ